MFYEIEMESGKKTWEAGGVFAPTDVHRQVLFSFTSNIYLYSSHIQKLSNMCCYICTFNFFMSIVKRFEHT